MEKLKVLIATNHLHMLGGTESYTYAIIEEMIKRNFDVQYFTFKKGIVSNKIEEELKVDFMSYSKYDIILANHSTCVKKLFLKGFIIQTCHGIYPDLEQPSKFADYHVAISEEVEYHLFKLGFKSQLIRNGINLERFSSKKKINDKLTNVLSLCQSTNANSIISNVCFRNKWKFSSVNKFIDNIWEIEEKINDSDIVIGLGRSAYEAMSCGRPVVIFDNRPYSKAYGDGYLTEEILYESLKNNCSGRRYKLNFNLHNLEEELSKYNRKDAEFLKNFVQKDLDIRIIVDMYLQLPNIHRGKTIAKKLFFRVKLEGGKVKKIFKN